MHLFSRLLPGLFRMYMCMQSTIITAVASPLTSLAADAAPPAPLAPIVPRQLSQFADGNNIENIHVRPNGHLLLSSFGTGNLFTLDPTAAVPSPLVIANLSGSTGLTGMATIDANAGLFAISGGVLTPFNFVQGSMAVYVVSVPSNSNTGSVRSRISVNGTLNGMAVLPSPSTSRSRTRPSAQAATPTSRSGSTASRSTAATSTLRTRAAAPLRA
jgi:hypothetical protein